MSGENGKRKLLSAEREQLILDALGGNMSTISELSDILHVSEATVRRDLHSLEEQGQIRRVHGGAIRIKNARTEPVFTEKAAIRAGEKEAIAGAALELIEDGDVICLDGGSTIQALAKKLRHRKNLTVVTNSLMAAAELMESGHRLILTGGEFRALSRTLVGPLTSNIINSLHIDKAFVGTIGFSIQDGISTTDSNEAYTKELLMKRSKLVVLLADSSKLGTASFASSGKISDIDILISDSMIDPNTAKSLKKQNIKLIIS